MRVLFSKFLMRVLFSKFLMRTNSSLLAIRGENLWQQRYWKVRVNYAKHFNLLRRFINCVFLFL